MLGITFDNTTKLDRIVEFLDTFEERVTVRLICDRAQDGFTWHQLVKPCKEISKRADILITICDSIYFKDHSARTYELRTRNALDQYGQWAKYFEIGNEIGGDWLGEEETVQRKVDIAGRLVKKAGKKRVVTWYYQDNQPQQIIHYMRNYPNEADYHLVSWYPFWYHTGLSVNWDNIFSQIVGLNPEAKVGFGEFGVEPKKLPDSVIVNLIKHVYSVKVGLPNFIGGYFYWNGYKAALHPYSDVADALRGKR